MLKECEAALRLYEGDIVEIGAGNGHNTIEFLKLAKKYNRTVIVIDPFESDWLSMPASYRYPYSEFEDRVKDYTDILHLHKRSSLCETSEEVCKKTSIAFAFVDGLQYKGAVLSDLRIVSHAKVIVVDDMDRQTGESQVPSAVHEYIKQTGKTLLIKDRWAIIT